MQEAVMCIFMVEDGAVAWIPENIFADKNPVKYYAAERLEGNIKID